MDNPNQTKNEARDYLKKEWGKILTNETNRILYLAGSPSNNDIAVVDSNECIRFFKPIGLKSSVKNNASNERYPTMLPGGPTIR